MDAANRPRIVSTGDIALNQPVVGMAAHQAAAM
jgi:hypothetical protein